MDVKKSQTRQRTLGFKLVAGVGAMLVLTVVGCLVAVLTSRNLGGQLTEAADVTARKVELIADIRLATQSMRTGQRGVILFSTMKQPERVAVADGQFNAAARQIGILVAELKPLLVTDAGRKAVEETLGKARDWMPLYQTVVAACQRGDYGASLTAAVDATFPLADAIDRATLGMRQTQHILLTQASRNAAAAISTSRWIAMGLLLLSLALGGVRSVGGAADDEANACDRGAVGRRR